MLDSTHLYSGHLSGRDRAGPIAGVLFVHVALALLLLGLGGRLAPLAGEQAIQVIDLATPPPAPPRKPPHSAPRRAAVEPAEAAPAGRRSEATPIVAPTPVVELPVPSPIVAAPVPGSGDASTQGAAASGQESGAGGGGSGTGGGGSGAGGDGDGLGPTTHPRPLFRSLGARNYPRDLVDRAPTGSRVFILFTVQTDGRISDCAVRQSSGDMVVDAAVCEVAQQRFRYEPARRADGTPVAAKAGYMQMF